MTDEWLPDLTEGRAPKYLAIADALGSAIERGNLSSGDRLPPQRDLAARLGVDLTTVTRAYETARQRGLIEARGRAGSFVRGASPAQIEDAARVDTGMNMPPELPGDMLGRATCDERARVITKMPVAIHKAQAASISRPVGWVHNSEMYSGVMM
jgi:DNA-binding transcriptional MocR family regulator